MGDEEHVKGMREAEEMAQAGMALFKKNESEQIIDTEAAAKYLADHEDLIKSKQKLEATLTGSDNKKERTAVGKEIKGLKDDAMYIDAQKIAKGLAPPKGNFMSVKCAVEEKPAAVPAEAKTAPCPKKEKAKKASDSAGISKEERQELEDLKKNIISKKAELKAAGKSGGECNKDPEIVTMVARMQELKIKEDPSLAATGGNEKKDKSGSKKEKSLEAASLEKEIEEYKRKLIDEFKYTKKELAADPDMQDMLKKLKGLTK